MQINLIRHAQTQANMDRRYLGRTDEPLSAAGIACFCDRAYPLAERVYVSPMQRCLQTAQILYPMEPAYILDGLRECDFGEFENKSHRELASLPAYQAWIASGGTTAPPGGEAPDVFKERCCAAFADAVEEALAAGLFAISFVVHGGTIMAVLERYGPADKGFYDWQPPNMGGFTAQVAPADWAEHHALTDIKPIQNGE